MTRIADDFLQALVKVVPCHVHTVFTDTGLHFTDSRCPGSAVEVIKRAIAASEVFRARGFDYAMKLDHASLPSSAALGRVW